MCERCKFSILHLGINLDAVMDRMRIIHIKNTDRHVSICSAESTDLQLVLNQ